MDKGNESRTGAQDKLMLQLYVTGMSPKSMQAIANINRFCGEHPEIAFELEIIDLYKQPELASAQQIIFCPALIKRHPLPQKILVGTFSNIEKIKKGLGIPFNE